MLLSELSHDETAPSAALHARALACLISLPSTEELNSLTHILAKANHLVGFPFESINRVVQELDILCSGLDEYENLCEQLVSIVERRSGEIAAARQLLQRGKHHLAAGRPYNAIGYVGRALYRLHKMECQSELVYALALLSQAYSDVGLLWAARSTMLHATSHTLNLFREQINFSQVHCFEKLRTIEMLIGRIGPTLLFHNIYLSLTHQLTKSSTDELTAEQASYFDVLLSLLIIKTRERDLSSLRQLPDSLSSLGLEISASTLLYRLLGVPGLPTSFQKQFATNEDIYKFFTQFLNQPAYEELPSAPETYLSSTVELRSTIVGCQFIVRASKRHPEIDIAEYILASLESFLATAIKLRAMSLHRDIDIDITRNPALGCKVAQPTTSNNGATFNISCGDFSPLAIKANDQEVLQKSIFSAVIYIMSHSMIFQDFEGDISKLLQDQAAGERAAVFSSPFIVLGNITGGIIDRSIAPLLADSKNMLYPYIPGACPWKVESTKSDLTEDSTSQDAKHVTELRHSQIKNISLIRPMLWDKAGWRATAFMCFKVTDINSPPILGLIFKDINAAREIFRDWKKVFGDVDINDELRVSVVLGISRANPTWYSLGVGTEVDGKIITHNTHVMSSTRVNTMQPTSSLNLERFIEAYKFQGRFVLAPADQKGENQPDILIEEGILKQKLEIRNAWEIGLHDLDRVHIHKGVRDPIVPENIEEPPIASILQHQKYEIQISQCKNESKRTSRSTSKEKQRNRSKLAKKSRRKNRKNVR